jgi:excinuclease UvrABC nuclease subunit
MEKTHKSILSLPSTSGVYIFLGKRKKVLYIGKATHLKNRVRSYFSSDIEEKRGIHIARMREEALSVEYRETKTVLHALILEAALIKEFLPPYNTREKDDKSFTFVVITMNEKYPRILLVRKKELEKTYSLLCEKGGCKKREEPLPTFGPFPYVSHLKEALRIVRKIFPFYDTKKPVEFLREKGEKSFLFNTAIKKYPPLSLGEKEYRKTMKYIILFFQGKYQELEMKIEEEMKKYAKKEDFENAQKCKKKLFALSHIQDVSLLKEEKHTSSLRIEGYDSAHLQGNAHIGVMAVSENGFLLKEEYRSFLIKNSKKGGDIPSLKEMLTRRFHHKEWKMPHMLVLDGGRPHYSLARSLCDSFGFSFPVVAVTKDEKHKPKSIIGDAKLIEKYKKDILFINAEAHRFSLSLHRKKMRKRMKEE